MAVCAVLLIATGVAIAVLLHSGRPIPRHVFLLDVVAKLSHSEVEKESTRKRRAACAA